MDGIREYPPLEGALQAEGLETTETYISRRQNMVAQYIATRYILNLCLEAERRAVLRVPTQWQKQAGLEFKVLGEAGGDDGERNDERERDREVVELGDGGAE